MDCRTNESRICEAGLEHIANDVVKLIGRDEAISNIHPREERFLPRAGSRRQGHCDCGVQCPARCPTIRRRPTGPACQAGESRGRGSARAHRLNARKFVAPLCAALILATRGFPPELKELSNFEEFVTGPPLFSLRSR